LWLLLSVSASASAGVWETLTDASSAVDWSGYLKNETAYRYYEPRSFTKIRNIISLKANYAPSDAMEITASAWYYHDLVYTLFDYDTVTARAERDRLQPLNFIEALNQEQDSNVLDVRELYLDVFLENMDVRIGRQFIVWGVMTGVRIVDEMNPMDFREMIFADLLDYRIPLWSLKTNYYLDNGNLELVWIPEIRSHRPAPSGSEWELLQEVPNTVYPDSFTLKNSEIAVKWALNAWDTDLTFSYFYTWDDFPVVFRRVRVDLTVEEPVFMPTYTRMHMFGTTFQRSMAGVVLKGEFAYVTDKYFGLATVDRDADGYLDSQGEIQKDHIRWGLGVDFNLFKTDFSPGITQWVILDYDEAIIQDHFDTALNLFVRKELQQQGAVFQALVVMLLNLDELYIRPKVSFAITDNFQFGVGLDLMYGQGSQVGVAAKDGKATDILEIDQRFQFIGNFSRNKRIFMEFKYSF